MGNMMTDGVIPSRHNETNNKNERWNSWVTYVRSVVEELPQCFQLRRLRKWSAGRKTIGSDVGSAEAVWGEPECPLTSTPPFTAASPRSRLETWVGMGFLRKWQLGFALAQQGFSGRSLLLTLVHGLQSHIPSCHVLVCNLPIWF